MTKPDKSKQRRAKFQYRRPDPKEIQRRASQNAGMYDNPFKPEIPVFFPQAGKSYRLRIMPATWEDARHYAFDVWVHSKVGPNNGRYPCLQKMKGKKCPVCEEQARVARNPQDKDLAYQLKAKKKTCMYIIDRDDEGKGPQLWPPSWQDDRAINAVAVDEETNEALFVDDPDNGYDIAFKCEKKGQYSELVGVKVARKSTPLSDDPATYDEWLDYVTEHPIPKTVLYYEYDHIAKALNGEGEDAADDADEDAEEVDDDRTERRRSAAPSTRSERRSRDADDELDEPTDDNERDDDKPEELEARENSRRTSRDEEDAPPPRKRLTSDRKEDRPRRRDEEDDEEPRPLSRRR